MAATDLYHAKRMVLTGFSRSSELVLQNIKRRLTLSRLNTLVNSSKFLSSFEFNHPFYSEQHNCSHKTLLNVYKTTNTCKNMKSENLKDKRITKGHGEA